MTLYDRLKSLRDSREEHDFRTHYTFTQAMQLCISHAAMLELLKQRGRTIHRLERKLRKRNRKSAMQHNLLSGRMRNGGVVDIEQLTKERDKAKRRIVELEEANDKLIDRIRYWSYCMSEGMRATCPEKVEELMDFLISCKIAPYYVAMEGKG